MRSTSSLAAALRNEFEQFDFVVGRKSQWSPESSTVTYDPAVAHGNWILLHETAHALLDHQAFERDIDLLKIERDAWHYAATQLAPRFDETIEHDFIESQLDTYRDWLHDKSTCPNCQANGIETAKQHYLCLSCDKQWEVNQGVSVGIRRYALATHTKK